MTDREPMFTTSRSGHDLLVVEELDGIVWVECAQHGWACDLGPDPTFGEIEAALQAHLTAP